jgi:iron complex transport system substrate-binding protein
MAALALACWCTTAHATPPRRIVSLNLCTDQLLLDLAPREKIAGLSWLSSDRNVSAITDEIAGLPLLKGTAEEVLALDPDLVLAGPYTTGATVDLLRRLGRRVEIVALAQDLDGVRGTIRAVAALVGEAARGEQMIALFERRLAAIARPASARQPTALAYQISGLVSGPDSLLDAVFRHVGLDNMARSYRLGRAGEVALETLVAQPPDLLVLAQTPGTYRTIVADNLRHPVLQRLLAERPHVVLDMPSWLCGTARIAEAAAGLAAARARLDAARTLR